MAFDRSNLDFIVGSLFCNRLRAIVQKVAGSAVQTMRQAIADNQCWGCAPFDPLSLGSLLFWYLVADQQSLRAGCGEELKHSSLLSAAHRET